MRVKKEEKRVKLYSEGIRQQLSFIATWSTKEEWVGAVGQTIDQ
jgi:hypothetical protein